MARSDNLRNFIVVAVTGLLIGALTLLPAGEVRVLSETRTVHLGELFGFRAVVFVLCVGLVAVAGLELLVRQRPAVVAAIGFGVVFMMTAMWIVAVEGASRIIPRQILPASVRRFSVGLGVDVGPWLVAALCIVAVLACMGVLEPALRRFRPTGFESSARYVGRFSSFLLAVAGAVLIGVGRTSPLARIAWNEQRVGVETWALPWLGPASLVVVMVVVVATVMAMLDIAAMPLILVGAGAAWLSASVAGLLVATSGLMVETNALVWAAERLGQDSIASSSSLSSGSGGAVLFAGSLIAGVGFVGLLLFGMVPGEGAVRPAELDDTVPGVVAATPTADGVEGADGW
jgi:hypothetical protein